MLLTRRRSRPHAATGAVDNWAIIVAVCFRSCGQVLVRPRKTGVGPPFRRSATPKDRDETWIAGWSSLTLTLTLTLGIRPIDLRPPMASLRNGGQDLRSGGPSEWRTVTYTEGYVPNLNCKYWRLAGLQLAGSCYM